MSWGALQTFAQRYLSPSAGSVTSPGSAVRYPQVWSTISEARRLSRTDTLTEILPRADMAAIGLGAFALFAAWRWRAMSALGPIVLLAALALLSHAASSRISRRSSGSAGASSSP